MDVIEFLARAGRDARLSHCPLQDLLSGPLGAELTAEARETLSGTTVHCLSEVLNAPALHCMQYPAEEEGEGEWEPEPDADEQPPKDGE